MGDNDYLITC